MTATDREWDVLLHLDAAAAAGRITPESRITIATALLWCPTCDGMGARDGGDICPECDG